MKNPPMSEHIEDDPSSYPGYIPYFMEQITADPTQYKKYSPVFTSVPAVIVRIPLNAAYVYDQDDQSEVVTISLDGAMMLLSRVATAIETMHEERREEIPD